MCIDRTPKCRRCGMDMMLYHRRFDEWGYREQLKMYHDRQRRYKPEPDDYYLLYFECEECGIKIVRNEKSL